MANSSSNGSGAVWRSSGDQYYMTSQGSFAPDTFFDHGVVLGRRTSDNLIFPLDPSATDGTETPIGVCQHRLFEQGAAFDATYYAPRSGSSIGGQLTFNEGNLDYRYTDAMNAPALKQAHKDAVTAALTAMGFTFMVTQGGN